ncbi:hypothetical protein [Streptomyces tsukubensis]|uniref:Transmembrane protein n=1 Tax=Streptomyces tsukubensis TaxID=83656 RepID=A0A1V4A3R9_9ACTN|nr:hypothetical protein [Streptomyces tsukubensis]OON75161.1 hypothetical protein B1H18_23705 [Streptomyces tsukubensis]QFR98052.1 hypothetical protein GBW32_27420 [Streptomyces tsukubensis]
MEAGPRDTAHGDAERLIQDGPPSRQDSISDDGPGPEEIAAASGPSGAEVEIELRPQRRLRLWQIAPIVAFAAIGSLMFAFPLAFEFGDGGAVVAMLGLLISSCAAGGALMAARRVGYTWPGLQRRGHDGRASWRVLALYVLAFAAVAVLAVWRVARLR